MHPDFFKGLRHGIPIGLGYLSVSFTFGMKAVGAGLTVCQAVAVSMLNVTSAGQFAGLPLMVGGAPMIEMVLTQLVINLRYALMSLSLSQKLDSSMTLPHRLLASFCNTDEIFAVASSQPGPVGWRYFYGLMLTPYLSWALGTLLGAAAGSLLPGDIRSALGIAIYGMFLAIIIPPAKKLRPVCVVVLLSAALSLFLRYTPGLNGISSGFAIILCAVIAAGLAAWRRPIREVDE